MSNFLQLRHLFSGRGAVNALWSGMVLVSLAAVAASAIPERGRDRIAMLFDGSRIEGSGAELAQVTSELDQLRAEMRLLELEKQALTTKLNALEPGSDSNLLENTEPSGADSIRVELTALPVGADADPSESVSEAEIMERLSSLAHRPASTRLGSESVPLAAVRTLNSASPDVASTSAFALELGVVESADEAGALWEQVSGENADILDGLEPAVAPAPGLGGKTVYRLLVGPFSNAATALNACVSMTIRGVKCDPAAYDGDALVMQ